jgi:S-(hydroxymethyl)glutathione dehydrogenase / alcohol dehydrogenase
VRAAVLDRIGEPLVIEELELDGPRAGEVLVRLAASGVCHSDLHNQQGVHPPPIPVVLGHEGAGIVESVGAGVAHVAPGDHVVLTWLPYCGRCRWCAAGHPARCENMSWIEDGTMPDGTIRMRRADGTPVKHYTTSSFAERTVVPAQTAIPVDPDLDLTQLALIGCAVMTGVGAVLNTACVAAGDTVAVVGCGGVGLNVVQGAAIAGAGRIVALDRVSEKLQLARELGATDTVQTGKSDDPVAVVRELTGGGADHSFEAVGRPDTITLAIDVTGVGGQAVLVGMAPPEARVAIDPLRLTTSERAVRGSWYGSTRPFRDVPRLIDLYRSGRLQLERLVTRCSLDQVNDALAAMETGSLARSVIVYER